MTTKPNGPAYPSGARLLANVTRLEVIDDTGRALTYPAGEPMEVELSFQDDDRTLKVFVRGRSSHRNIYCPFCSGLVWAPVQFTVHHFDGCPHAIPKEGPK